MYGVPSSGMMDEYYSIPLQIMPPHVVICADGANRAFGMNDSILVDFQHTGSPENRLTLYYILRCDEEIDADRCKSVESIQVETNVLEIKFHEFAISKNLVGKFIKFRVIAYADYKLNGDTDIFFKIKNDKNLPLVTVNLTSLTENYMRFDALVYSMTNITKLEWYLETQDGSRTKVMNFLFVKSL